MEEGRILEIIQNQNHLFLTNKTKNIGFRIEMLKNLKKAIIAYKDEIVASVQKDFGTGVYDAYGRIVFVIDELNYFIRDLKKWSKPVKVNTPITLFNGKSRYVYEPYGISLIISAWNAPYMVTFLPLIAAIGAGNCSIIKPSEVSPASSKVISEIIRSAFNENFCAVIEGGIAETTFLLEQRFDFICYTGSTHVGKIVYEAASKNLTPVILELGGKSPCIVDESADLRLTAKRICTAKFMNTGQVCTSPDYIVVHTKVKDRLISELKQCIKNFYKDNALASSDYTQIINEKHFDRVLVLLKSVHQDNIEYGGKYDRDCFKIEPTIINNINWDDVIMKEEIFGPLLPVITYNQLDDVIIRIKQREKPLALYVYSKNRYHIKKIVEETSSGGMGINISVLHFLNRYLPFGGVGHSGIGKYRGKTGFETFSNKKAIFDKSLWFESNLLNPPFGNKHRILEYMIK